MAVENDEDRVDGDGDAVDHLLHEAVAAPGSHGGFGGEPTGDQFNGTISA